jgi:hypothetical protein
MCTSVLSLQFKLGADKYCVNSIYRILCAYRMFVTISHPPVIRIQNYVFLYLLICSPLRMKHSMFLSKPSLCYELKTLCLGHKTSQLMVYNEIITVCSEIHKKHINALSEQNLKHFNIEPHGV